MPPLPAVRFLPPILLGSLAACGGDGVTPPPTTLGVATVEVTAPGGVLAAGATMQLTATARDAAGTVLAGASFTWQSSSPQAATVTAQGVVRGVGEGPVTISAVAEGRTGSVPLAVRDTAGLPATISGRVDRVDLVIPAGQVVRITGDAVLSADSTLAMAGTILVDPGKHLTLYGGKLLRITGAIDGDSASGLLFAGNRIEHVGAAQAAPERGHGPEGLRPTPVVGIVSANGPIYYAGLFTVIGPGASIQAGTGAPGTHGDRDGKPGFPIEIGTPLARDEVPARTGHPPLGPSVYLKVDRSLLTGGIGGSGYTVSERADGEDLGGTWRAEAGSGGKGGKVVLQAVEIVVELGAVNGGTGGKAGEVNPVPGLRDGIRAGGGGEWGEVTSGSGGDGGDITFIGQVTSAGGTFTPGQAVAGGPVKMFGGRGLSGGPGGNVVARIGRPGAPGTGTGTGVTFTPTAPPAVLPGVEFLSVGNGGAAGDPFEPGGQGGPIEVTGVAGSTAQVSEVRLFDSGNGGRGYDGCSASQRVNGTSGGDAGNLRLRINGVLVFNPGYPSSSGGHGGNGVAIAGGGGNRGMLLEGPGAPAPIGTDGQDGILCPPASTILTAASANVDAGIQVASLIDGVWSLGPSTNDPAIARPVALAQLFPSSAPQGSATLLTAALGPVGGSSRLTILNQQGNSLTVGETLPLPEPVFSIGVASEECVLAALPQAQQVRSYTSGLSLVSQFPFPGLTAVVADPDQTIVLIHGLSGMQLWDVDPFTCAMTPRSGLVPTVNTRAVAFSGFGSVPSVVEIVTPPGQASNLRSWTFGAGGAASLAGSVAASGSRYSGRTEWIGRRFYAAGDFGQVDVFNIDANSRTLTPVGSAQLSGADQLEFHDPTGSGLPWPAPGDGLGTAGTLVYTNVASPSQGRLCAVAVGANGLPEGQPVCQQNTGRPRPDSDLVVFRPTSQAAASRALAPGGTPDARP